MKLNAMFYEELSTFLIGRDLGEGFGCTFKFTHKKLNEHTPLEEGSIDIHNLIQEMQNNHLL